ncbi:pentapeptide repeat-containing protein [Planktothrix agardhii CCAP 1459/11A]|uniref:Pentapeptide repeat-containing protein n=1 Tax=Planktothrix agardhii CCAP 1459/11A TaxID=282420 RepID=A0A4P5ZWQ4_PLAAG|nr:pentapeptide repeat-containing protein [Planktothrix agardhii CCAP 1459/11A]
MNLEGADLRNSTLDMARFRRTNLTNAILEGAYAYNAEFEGAIIEGADFTDVMLRKDSLKTLCKVATGTNPVTGRNTRDTLYCD